MFEAEKNQTIFFESKKENFFPGVIGCVDGTTIQAPNKDQHSHFDRKGFFSFNAIVFRIPKILLYFIILNNFNVD